MKPIFVIGINVIPNNDDDWERLTTSLKKSLPDYSVLVYINELLDDFTFRLFNAEDADEVKIEEIKQIIKDSLNEKED